MKLYFFPERYKHHHASESLYFYFLFVFSPKSRSDQSLKSRCIFFIKDLICIWSTSKQKRFSIWTNNETKINWNFFPLGNVCAASRKERDRRDLLEKSLFAFPFSLNLFKLVVVVVGKKCLVFFLFFRVELKRNETTGFPRYSRGLHSW